MSTHMDDLVTVLLQHGHCLCPVDGQPLLDGLLLVVKVGPLLQSGHHLLGTDGQVDDPEHVNMDIKSHMDSHPITCVWCSCTKVG